MPAARTGRPVKAEGAGPTGVGSASSAALFRPARVLIPDFSAGIGTSTRSAGRVRQDGGAPSRYQHRARKLTAEQESAIRALAGARSLRSLAAEFGVSHETVRAVLRTGASTSVDEASRVVPKEPTRLAHPLCPYSGRKPR